MDVKFRVSPVRMKSRPSECADLTIWQLLRDLTEMVMCERSRDLASWPGDRDMSYESRFGAQFAKLARIMEVSIVIECMNKPPHRQR
jgi:hypothetical protein